MSLASRLDPTRTTSLRRRFAGATAARFRRVSQRLRELIDAGDAFGLARAAGPGVSLMLPAGSRRWAALDRAGQVKAFRLWLRGQLSSLLLSANGVAGHGSFWTDPFIAAAYRRGLLNAYADARPDRSAGTDDRYAGGLEQFLRDMTQTPAGLGRIQQLQERAANGVEDITTTLFARLGRAVADGLAAKMATADLVAALVKVVRSETGRRAIPLAYTEVAHAHAEAQLDGYERMGHTHVNLVAEHLPTRRTVTGNASRYDGFKAVIVSRTDACDLCQEKGYREYTIAYARGIIPIHPRCFCGWALVKDRTRAA